MKKLFCPFKVIHVTHLREARAPESGLPEINGTRALVCNEMQHEAQHRKPCSVPCTPLPIQTPKARLHTSLGSHLC